MTPPRCRTAPTLASDELAALELLLDIKAAHPLAGKTLGLSTAMRLMATARELQRREAAAFGMLAVDADPLTPPNTPMPGDFGTDPASDWPTDFPQDS
jgi:hypothetical protein